MGRKGKRGNKGRGQNRGGGWHTHGARADFAEIVKQNEKFETYYNALELVPEDEKEDFWATMRRELPNSFRFTGSKGHALAVQQRLVDHYIPEISSVEYEGSFVDPPQQVSWFPEKLAWQMTTPKNVVRKFPPFASFQRFLVAETSVGNISRQEVVSMIPPLLMDIHPHMTVLDMCAAPGSKSAQLIEMIHGGEEARIRKWIHQLENEQDESGSPDGIETALEVLPFEDTSKMCDDGRTTGLLIANDVEYKRAQMLVHQVKRLNSPNLIVTNHDAQFFPSIRIPSKTQAAYLKFDRILADVPCSGDGTGRKNYTVWKDWTPGNGLGLHPMQTRILVRALQMLKVGGRAVYSTCSLNPVENEAVVAEAIRRCGGTTIVRVIDCSKELPGLKRTSGLRDWKVMDKTGRMWSNFSEVEATMETATYETREVLKRLSPTVFAPTTNDEETRVPLERCIRIYPHFQDTGGFFITVLEKLSEIKAPTHDSNKWKINSLNSAPNGTPRAINVDTTLKSESAGEALAKVSPVQTELSKKRELDSSELEYNGAKRRRTNSPEASTDKAPADSNELQSAEARTLNGMKTEDTDTVSPSLEMKNEHETSVKKQVAKLNTTAFLPDLPETLLAPTVKSKSQQPYEEPYKYLPGDHPELLRIYDYYQISPRFPRDRFMVRNAVGEPAKAIYYTSTLVRDILQINEGKGLKFVQCGVKMFMKQDAQGQDICRWRIQAEGIPILEPWVGQNRIVRLYKQETLRKLLIELFIKVSGDLWKELDEIGERVRDIGMGCCVLRVEPSDGEDGFRERLVLPLWRSISSVNLMLPKEDRRAMLVRLFNDKSELIDRTQVKKDAIMDDQVVHENAAEDDALSATQIENADSPSDALINPAIKETTS